MAGDDQHDPDPARASASSRRRTPPRPSRLFAPHRLRRVRGDGRDHRDADRRARPRRASTYYALAFAAPFASGVVGMVAAGMWSDRSGPRACRCFASMAIFSAGLLVCGLAPSMEVLARRPGAAGPRQRRDDGGGLRRRRAGVSRPRCRPAVFASFAAAWVLPALFGPGLAALSPTCGLALGLPRHGGASSPSPWPCWRRRCAAVTVHAEGTDTPVSRLWWAVLGAVAVLALELVGSARGVAALGAAGGPRRRLVSLGRLLPPGSRTLRARGLPSVMVTRGLLSRDLLLRRGLHRLRPAGALGPLARSGRHRADLRRRGLGRVQPGPVAAGHPVTHTPRDESRHDRRAHRPAGIAAIVLLAHDAGAASVRRPARGGYVFASVGMGFAYPRTGVAMLAVTDRRATAASTPPPSRWPTPSAPPWRCR